MSDLTKELMRSIDETAVEVLDLASREDAKETAGSRRKAYEKGISEVREIAGKPQARALAEWIQEEVRADGDFPTARQVRKKGAEICRESGHEVSTSSWLGA